MLRNLKIHERCLLWLFYWGFFPLYVLFAVIGLGMIWVGSIRCNAKLVEQGLKATYPFVFFCTAIVTVVLFCGVMNLLGRLVRLIRRRFQNP